VRPPSPEPITIASNLRAMIFRSLLGLRHKQAASLLVVHIDLRHRGVMSCVAAGLS
jgi:hypothetical protein